MKDRNETPVAPGDTVSLRRNGSLLAGDVLEIINDTTARICVGRVQPAIDPPAAYHELLEVDSADLLVERSYVKPDGAASPDRSLPNSGEPGAVTTTPPRTTHEPA